MRRLWGARLSSNLLDESAHRLPIVLEVAQKLLLLLADSSRKKHKPRRLLSIGGKEAFCWHEEAVG